MGKISVSREKGTKHLTLKVYPVLVGAVGLAIALLVMGRYASGPDLEPSDDAQMVDPRRLSPEIPPAPSEVPSDSSLGQPSPSASSPATPSPTAAYLSNLRVSNRTQHPLRVAILPQKPKVEADSKDAEAASGDAGGYDAPAHWDFAPGEGSRQGLLLSLPDRDLQLQPGDVLVAFTQDGSRLYWGPYVVGSTPLPLWNETAQEWQLILEP